MSTTNDLREELSAQIRVLQIIVTAVALGPLVYLGVVVSMAPPAGPPAAQGGLSSTLMACAMAAAAVTAWLVVPPLVTRKFRRQIAAGAWPPTDASVDSHAAPMSDAGKLGAVYNVRTIIAVALLEGATFFLVFAYQHERNPLALGVGVALMVGIALHLPTPTRVVEWVERQLVRLAEDRQAEQFRR
jgi:hypothetical protein